MYGTPSSAAAFPMCTSAFGWASAPAPTGAKSTGAESFWPNSSISVVRSLTSRSTRGTIAHRSSAARLAAMVRPSPAPPAM